FRSANVFAHLFFQQRQWQASVAQNDIVKFADIEARAELFFRQPPHFQNLELAHLVRKRLAWPGNIAIDLGKRLRGRVQTKVGDRLVAIPALRMNARVDHEPYRPEQFAAQLSEAAIRILIKAKLRSKRFRIERPTLAVSAVRVEAPVIGKSWHSARDRS